jgi:hypothetical protein
MDAQIGDTYLVNGDPGLLSELVYDLDSIANDNGVFITFDGVEAFVESELGDRNGHAGCHEWNVGRRRSPEGRASR